MKHLLIVDDQPHLLRILRLTLERNGFRVTTAINGNQAWQLLQTQRPDLLITDIDMPNGSGKELSQRIRAELGGLRLPIIIMTSRTELEHRDWASELSDTVFLEKPVSLSSVVDAIGRLRVDEVA